MKVESGGPGPYENENVIGRQQYMHEKPWMSALWIAA